MPNAATKKTKSAPKKPAAKKKKIIASTSDAKLKNYALKSRLFVGLGIVLLIAACTVLILQFRSTAPELKVGRETIQLEVVKTEAARQKGLSGRSSLDINKGMLFDFSNGDGDGSCFWMKDMQFPIDIIWLNSDKQIIKIEPSVAPNTYPNAFCSLEKPYYVIELKAGRAKELGIHVGQPIDV